MIRLGAVISPDRGKGKSATRTVQEHRTSRQHTEVTCESTVALSVLENRKESTRISISEKGLQTMQQHFLPILPWIGGKRRLAKQILPRFPAHICYVEPFCGAAALFFMKSPSKAEVINDINGELVNLYRVLKQHLEEFMRQFKWALVSRAMYQWLNITPTETLTDIQRAARFYYLQKQAFGGKVAEHTFGVTTTSGPRLNLLRMEEELSLAHLRLSRTTIEHLDWASCIARYDRPHTLFYCDPPYWGTEGYGVDFGLEQYEKLAGMMIISVNDIPEMREVFRDFAMESVPIRYTLNGNQPTQRRELIITVK